MFLMPTSLLALALEYQAKSLMSCASRQRAGLPPSLNIAHVMLMSEDLQTHACSYDAHPVPMSVGQSFCDRWQNDSGKSTPVLCSFVTSAEWPPLRPRASEAKGALPGPWAARARSWSKAVSNMWFPPGDAGGSNATTPCPLGRAQSCLVVNMTPLFTPTLHKITLRDLRYHLFFPLLSTRRYTLPRIWNFSCGQFDSTGRFHRCGSCL